MAIVFAVVDHTEASDIDQASLRHPVDLCTEMMQLSPSIWSLLQNAHRIDFEQLALLCCRIAGRLKCDMGRVTHPVNDAMGKPLKRHNVGMSAGALNKDDAV
jgi:hypothetical protein